ncbi:MAG: hypothetical protein R3A44_00425 [Caldilineaceae bacterium]
MQLRQDGAPASLLGALLTIYAQYRANRGEIPGVPARGREGVYQNKSLYMGPWLWNMIYQLARMASGQIPNIEDVQAIQKELLETGGVERMSLSARWAQFITREGAKQSQ